MFFMVFAMQYSLNVRLNFEYAVLTLHLLPYPHELCLILMIQTFYWITALLRSSKKENGKDTKPKTKTQQRMKRRQKYN